MFQLEPIEEYRLVRPPLKQALAQVRFPLVAKVATLGGLAPLQDALADDFPFVQHVQETSLTVDMSGEPDVRSELSSCWHFTDEEGRLLALTTTSMTLSLDHQYDGVSDFLRRFMRALVVIKQHLSLRRCDRIGIKFLDIVSTDSVDEAGQSWRAWFEPALLGWSASSIVADRARIDSAISQTQLSSLPDGGSDVPAGMAAVVRHGVANQGSLVPGIPPVVLQSQSFMIDLDFFITAQQAFHVDAIVEQARLMHGQIDRFFRWTLTADGERYFGVKERS